MGEVPHSKCTRHIHSLAASLETEDGGLEKRWKVSYRILQFWDSVEYFANSDSRVQSLRGIGARLMHLQL